MSVHRSCGCHVALCNDCTLEEMQSTFHAASREASLQAPARGEPSLHESLEEAREAEAAAKRRVLQLQRQVAEMRLQQAQQRRKVNKSMAVKAVRDETDRLTGTDLRAKFDKVKTAGDAEVTVLSELLNKQAIKIIADPNARGWFKLFNHMDDDRSGRISYKELIGMVREELRLDSDDLSDGRVQAVWKALDTDGSGFIGAGEFGAFMRKGEAKPGMRWQDRRLEKNVRSRLSMEEAKAGVERMELLPAIKNSVKKMEVEARAATSRRRARRSSRSRARRSPRLCALFAGGAAAGGARAPEGGRVHAAQAHGEQQARRHPRRVPPLGARLWAGVSGCRPCRSSLQHAPGRTVRDRVGWAGGTGCAVHLTNTVGTR